MLEYVKAWLFVVEAACRGKDWRSDEEQGTKGMKVVLNVVT